MAPRFTQPVLSNQTNRSAPPCGHTSELEIPHPEIDFSYPLPLNTAGVQGPEPHTATSNAPASGAPALFAPSPDVPSEYSFLLPILSPPTLNYASHLAAKWNSPLHEVLISLGWISEETYCNALATHLHVRFINNDAAKSLRVPKTKAPISILPEPAIGLLENSRKSTIVLNGRSVGPTRLKEIIGSTSSTPTHLAIATQSAMRKAGRAQNQQNALNRAKDHLANTAPALSASTGMWPSQAMTASMLMGMLIGALAIAPKLTVTFILGLLTLPFLIIVILRLATIPVLFNRHPEKSTPIEHDNDTALADADLPVYSILVPLFKEHEVLPDLIEALKTLDYPTTKTDIKIILESVDLKTIQLAKSLNLPGNFDIIIVPKGGPQTKPKALNYALQYAKGEYVVIYDAEDEPEPNQLRAALELFRKSGPEIACIQAQLNIYNARENWLTRQFTIEYTALFDGLLPAFERLNMPIMLGGTSNHFRVSVLRKIGAWDPYNVTEDADLGIRINRQGYKCKILASTTYEEAPTGIKSWTHQRTRWLKGWLQTFLVHTRNTERLRQDMGSWRYIGFQAILGGAILSALIHPIFYVGLSIEFLSGDLLTKPTDLFGTTLWHAALINLSCGYLAAIVLAWVTLVRRSIPSLIIHTIGMPIYWLLISFAAYRAVFQLIWNPFLWEKTRHTRSDYRTSKAPTLL